MPLIPNSLERFAFFNLNLAPAPLFDLFSAAAFRAVLAGLELGVFDTLDKAPATPAELAPKLAVDTRGLAVLLSALAKLGYLHLESGEAAPRYRNAPMTVKWLVKSSPDSIAAGFAFWKMVLNEHWQNLEISIRTGQPPLDFYAWVEQHPQASRDFQNWMIALARIAGPEMVSRVKLSPGARRLLDVGGGHGAYSAAFLRRYPQLSAVVFDSPQALEAARGLIAAEPLGGRLTVQAGDFLNDSLGSGYDAVLLFNIVHGFTAEQNTALLGKVAAALNPGGTVVVAEQVESHTAKGVPAALSALLGLGYYHLLGGRLYEQAEIAGWLTAAGFGKVKRTNLLRTPGTTLIAGWKA
jgi:SAM-dependent methyltransferase